MREVEFTAGEDKPPGAGGRPRPVEFTACGPVGKFTREGLRDVLLVYAGAIGFRILIKVWARSQAGVGVDSTPGTLLAAGAVLAGAAAAFGFVRILQRKEWWTLFFASGMSFASLFRFDDEPLAAGTALEKPLVLLPLVPAAIGIAAFVAMVRETDELQRRIVYQSLSLAFAVTFAATTVYALLEDLGLPRVSAVWWLAALALSWIAGLAIFSRRYR